MKNFLEIWSESFPGAVTQKLGIEASWEPADELPVATGPLAVELRWQGEWNGRCVLIAAWGGVSRLMGEASAKDKAASAKTPDEDAAARWLKWVREVIAAMLIPVQPQTVELIERPRGVPLVPYMLSAGKLAVPMALVCEVNIEGGQGKASPNADAGPEGAGVSGVTGTGAGATTFAGSGNRNLDLLLDIEVDASLRFGSREIAIRELLATGPGDVLELDRTISDPVDLVVGDKIVARGEVVLVNGNFGLRVTEVAEPRKCLESVRCLF